MKPQGLGVKVLKTSKVSNFFFIHQEIDCLKKKKCIAQEFSGNEIFIRKKILSNFHTNFIHRDFLREGIHSFLFKYIPNSHNKTKHSDFHTSLNNKKITILFFL